MYGFAEIFDEYCETTKRERLEREQRKNGSIFAKVPILENVSISLFMARASYTPIPIA